MQLLVEPGRRIFIDSFAALGPHGLDFTSEFAIAEVGALQQVGTQLQGYRQPFTGQGLVMNGEIAIGIGIVSAAQTFDDFRKLPGCGLGATPVKQVFEGMGQPGLPRVLMA
ncbi:hypothetical protein D3C75_1138610 [compost metagenome]